MSINSALTHAYRPRKLGAFAGNTVVIDTVRGMLTSGKIPQVWLLEGGPGCGKTSMGRFLSMRLNCTEAADIDPDPCGQCDSCEGMLHDPPVHPCHIEVNCSDNRKIDDARSLIRQAKFMPSGGKKRIMLLDEPQGLIKEAQQALLTPLENPKPNTVWVFCTTDPAKLLPAIRSRARAGHLVFRRVESETLAKHLYRICKKEDVDVPKKVLVGIAEMEDGHPRAAIGTLEKVISYMQSGGDVSKVDPHDMIAGLLTEDVEASPWHASLGMLEAIFANDLAKAVRLAKGCDAPAEIVLGFIATHWTQAVYRAVDPTLVDKSHGWYFQRMRVKPKFNMHNMNALHVGDWLNLALERAKEHVQNDKLLLVNALVGMRNRLALAAE